jgi:hypothetical protein
MRDEALLPFCPTGIDPNEPSNHIVDDELATVVGDANLHPEVKLTFVLDSCHSGGMLRDLVLDPTAQPVPRCYVLPPDVRNRDVGAKPSRGFASMESLGSNYNHIIIAAAQDYESAWDSPYENGSHGVFSFNAVPMLQANPRISFRHLVEESTPLVSRMFPQHPRLLGSEARADSSFLS